MRLAFVDTPAAVLAARAAGDARLVTDNPMLAADPRCADVVNIERRVTQDLANRLGKSAIEMSETIDQMLRCTDAPAAIGIPAEHLQLSGTLCRLISTLLHRAAAFALDLRENAPDAIVLRVADSAAHLPQSPAVLPIFFCPHVALGPAGFFGSVPFSIAHMDGVQADNPGGEFPDDAMRKLAHRPLAEIAHTTLTRLGITNAVARGPTLLVGIMNEALRETLPWLACRGFRFKHVGKLNIKAVASPRVQDDPALISAARQAVTTTFQEFRPQLQLFGIHELAALETVITNYVATALTALRAHKPELETRIATLASELAAPRIMMTNGLFGPVGAMYYGLLRRAGFTVIDFEHGFTTGLSLHSQQKIRFSEASTCDVHLVCADEAAKRFAEAAGPSKVRHEVIGLADQTRRLLRPRLQRRLARRSLGLHRSETAIMHVSTWTYMGNRRPGYGTQTETFVWQTDRRLIEEVYARVPHTVLFKEYPTQRLPFHPPYAELLSIPANMRILPREDFRFVRAAADVIVTAVPTSTLGWVMGAGVPVIWLDSREVNPLITEAWRDVFRASFLFIDIDSADWPDRLSETLSRPLSALRKDWAERYQARRSLLARAITGPPGTVGRRAARIVADEFRLRSIEGRSLSLGKRAYDSTVG